MHEADTMVTDVIPLKGRHRLSSSPLRRALSPMSLGGAAVVVTIGVGVLAAASTGLTGGASETAASLPKYIPTEVPADPTPARAAAVAARPTVEAAPAPEAQAEPAPAVVVEADEPAPTAAPSATEAPAPIPTVRKGAPCPVEGAQAMTVAGKPVTCTGEGRTRWRHT